ncbi:MAG: methylmalonyl-CoA mutase family protein [Planctomycetes bacterium]|nr:methylmalonyl-CoA mutase family protein [Planctomycetota bacterium]
MNGSDGDLERALKAWEETVAKLKKEPRSRFPCTLVPEEPILYTPLNLKGFDPNRDLGTPGSYPYTRGPHENMYHGKLWTMRMFSGFGTARDTNQRFKYLLEHGQTGLSIAFDMPTLMGYDSDHARAKGEVGREGVAVCTVEDMQTLFDGIPMAEVSTSMTINSTAAILLAFYVAVAEQQGVRPDRLRGTIQNDILKEYIAQKEWIFPPRPSMRIITDMMAFCAERVPKWNTISISGYHIREAGSTALQELAYTLMDGFTYVEFGLQAGIPVDVFAPRLSFFFNSHMNFFEEIAKFRAARRIWARHMKERYGAKNPESWRLRFHTQTAGCSLTAQQPENNIIRTTIEALAAVLGGTQSLHTNSMDEALALPTEHAVKIALRTQQILAHESGLADVIDPLAGSYFVEALTNRMEAEAEKIFKTIEEMGGMIPAIERGYPQREIARAAYEFQKAVEERRYVVVGVNEYVDTKEKPPPILKIDPKVERDQVAAVQKLKKRRDSGAVKRALADIAAAATENRNLMPPILAAVKRYATLGEVVEVLKAEFGEWREPPTYW